MGESASEGYLSDLDSKLKNLISERSDKQISKLFQDLDEKFNDKVESLKTSIGEEFTKEISNLKRENQELQKKLESMNEQFKDLERKIISSDKADKESTWTSKIDDLESYNRKYNIEISGIEEHFREDPAEIVLKLAEHLEVSITRQEIVAAHRIKSNKPEQPRPILVRFTTLSPKHQLYKKSRQQVDTNGKLIPVYSNAVFSNVKYLPIYVNENLTTYKKKLLGQAKQSLRPFYKYIWPKDGKIFARLDANSDITSIHSEVDIKNLLSAVESSRK